MAHGDLNIQDFVRSVSIPKRVSEVLWQFEEEAKSRMYKFQSLKGFQRFCGQRSPHNSTARSLFQSLKGFQRFCGKI